MRATALDYYGMSSHPVGCLNLFRVIPRPPGRDQVRTRILGLYSQRYRLAKQPDNGNHRNRFPFVDNFGTAPASIPFHGIG